MHDILLQIGNLQNYYHFVRALTEDGETARRSIIHPVESDNNPGLTLLLQSERSVSIVHTYLWSATVKANSIVLWPFSSIDVTS